MTTTTNSRSKRAAAGALSLAAVCGTIAFLRAPQHETLSSSSSSSSGLESSPLAAHLPPASLLPASSSTTTNNDDQPLHLRSSSQHRKLSEALPNGGCQITWPKKPPPGVPVTYAASYPGCGARMTWNLVEALTGMWTGDDWNNNGRGEEVVTVKTHFPQSNGILVDFDEKILRGFIVIRNPMKSIPSFFNHIYEMRNHLPVHSERAPLEEWIKWRNAYLDTEIAEYKKFIYYWMDRYSAENRLLITYEGLTDDLIGAEVTKGLNEFLGRVEGVTTIATESVACVWRAVVKNEPPEQQKAQIAKLQEQAVNQPQGGFDGPPAEAVQLAEAQTAQVAEAQGAAAAAGPSNEQVLDATLQKIQNLQSASGGVVGTDPQLLSPGGDVAGGATPALGDPGADPQVAEAQNQLAMVQQQIAELNQAAPVEELSVEQQLLNTQQQLLQMQQQQQGAPASGGLMRRRLDPGHHNSQRAGPEVPRPYTPEQLDKMMAMLTEVAQKYQAEDVRLYHIVMGYYEQIRVERAKLSTEGGAAFTPPGGFY